VLFIDAGTSYTKVFDLAQNNFYCASLANNSSLSDLRPAYATGHNAVQFSTAVQVNELVALGEGAFREITEPDFIVLDVGSRDMKIVEYRNRKFYHCDWNSMCGAMVGFTIDLMLKYFNKTYDELPVAEKPLDITCGLLGINQFFDKLHRTSEIETGLSSLIYGFARFSWQFAGRPKKIYISGGLSENKLFLNYLNQFCVEVIPLGRYLLVKGLKYFWENRTDETDFSRFTCNKRVE
jgi:activator of 2-hydroxyglutaryl-CoA dehydratase